MIGDFIEYGKWLSNNNLDDFGKDTKDADYIFVVNYNDGEFNLDNLYLKNNVNDHLNYFDKSIFSQDFLISTDQRFMIPSKSNLLGLSPFFIKLDHDFLKNGETDSQKIQKFKNKIERSINSNSNNKEFVAALSNIYADSENFIKDCALDNEKKEIFSSFFLNNTFEDVSLLIVNYYKFILENMESIVSRIIELKSSDDYDKRSRPNFYLSCCFGDSLDLINDLFIFYSKIFKKRDEKINDFDEGTCSFCGRESITYSSLGSYALSKSASFNFSENMSNSRLRICKLCNSYLRTAEDNLKKALNGPMMIIPKSKGIYDYESFVKISNLEDKSSFSKINEFLKENSNQFNYDLVFYNEGKGNTYIINKYVENYQAFLIDFNREIKLYDNGLNYLFNEKYFENIEEDTRFVNNLFDLEKIFKYLFIKFDDEQIKYPNLYHFYNIYTKDLTGSSGILYGFDSKTVSIFAKYMHSIFNFIYELNEDALNKKMINELFLNVLIKLQRNGTNKKSYKCKILNYLNYYFMIIKEFLGESMLEDENVKKLKEIFSTYHKDDGGKKISEEDEKKIFETIEKDVSLKYYLIGQFISLIDNTKSREGKNSDIFSNFVLNANKNNIKKLFTTEVLQKNNYYIGGMNKKGKFIFKILENNFNELFDEDDFYFEDYLLLIFTGYYTENILSSNYGA
ncbi:MAG: hypothetical protein PUB95_00035 [Methanobrevibacter ruminantium]|uniref:hypothetical protein n=1 Tax=Methanobrevibacter ruminantium TaxID=83816 RepID=UPI0026F31CDD|nr:hypothetical protein [Methanobrevibacter ruminantium]MDD6047832.1 hypothetical protein [Methanobrevibacter ruminantium]